MLLNSFPELFRAILVRMFDENIPLPQDDEIWQELFYHLKDEMAERIPALSNMRFNWDSPPAHSSQISLTLNGFRFYGFIQVRSPKLENELDSYCMECWRRDLFLSPENSLILDEIMGFIKTRLSSKGVLTSNT